MVRRHNRLLVAFHIATDAVLGMVAFLLAYVIRFDSGLIPVTRGLPAARAVPQRPALHRGDRAGGLPPAGPLPAAPRTLAHRRLLQRPRRQHLRRRARRGRHALLPGLLRPGRAEEPRRLRGVAAGLGPVPRLQHRARLPVAEVHPRGAGAPVDCGGRPAPRADCRHRRPRAAWSPTRFSSTANWATRSSASSTIAPAAITWATAGCRCSAR